MSAERQSDTHVISAAPLGVGLRQTGGKKGKDRKGKGGRPGTAGTQKRSQKGEIRLQFDD